MKIMTMLAVVLFCIGPAAGSPAAAQNETLTPAPDEILAPAPEPPGEIPGTEGIVEEAVTEEEYSPPEDLSGDIGDAPPGPSPEAVPEPTPASDALDPGAWELSPGTEILVPDGEDGYWYPAAIVDVSAGMFTVRYLDPGKPDEVLDREDFRVQALTEGMVVKFYAEGDELIDGVIVSRQGRNCSVAMKVDGNVRDVDCGTIVVPSP